MVGSVRKTTTYSDGDEVVMVIGTSFSWVRKRACEGEGSSDERA